MALLNRFCENREYASYQDFYQNYRLIPPEGFNFGYDVVDAIAAATPGKRAMLWVGEDGAQRDFSFGDMKRLSDKAANVFLSLGIRKGDRVLLALKRHYQYWYALVALHKIGAVAIPATHQLVKKDYAYRFQAAQVSAAVCTLDDGAPAHILAALPQCPTVRHLLAARPPHGQSTPIPQGFLDFDALVDAAAERFTPVQTAGGSDPMLMYFTSGTTGYPKMVLHDFCYPLGHIPTARYWHRVQREGLHFTISDTGWAKAAWGKIYGSWLCEAPVFTYDFHRFHAADILEKMQQYRITTFCAPPTMYRYIIKEPLEQYDLSSLAWATTAGEALNPEVAAQFYEKTGLTIHEGFGQSETTLALATFPFMDVQPGSMGRPTPGFDVCILNGDGEPATIGEPGEICINTQGGKPAGLFLGYYQDQALTQACWHDGWYHTGDMAWRDGKGYFWYVGRTDDVIKSSGYRIGPFEVESALMEHPSVLECAVTAVPDPVRGQAVKATIVLSPGYEGSPELVKTLQNHVKQATAPYKYPRIVEFVDVLPKTFSGKVMRKAIREQDQGKQPGADESVRKPLPVIGEKMALLEEAAPLSTNGAIKAGVS